MPPLSIRSATSADSAAIAAIYDHHVRTGTASFDLEGPSAGQWAIRIETILARRWPFLIAEEKGLVAGYTYASQFRDRPAYVHSCESSIYVAPDRVGQGIGTQLLQKLKQQARKAGFDQMIAVVGGAEPSSMALHLKCGFEERGRMREVGFKFGRRLDTVYLQCALGEEPVA